MRLSSPAFEEGETIPDQYSKEGGNQRPPLRFEDVPSTAQSLALPEGTVKARLSRGREMLRSRLSQRFSTRQVRKPLVGKED